MATYKCCIVPMCNNTSIKEPLKKFLHLPRDVERRKKWLQVMKREKPISPKCAFYVCEDHFDLQEDLDNYWRWKLLGDVKKLRVKDGVVPHKFDCQKGDMLPVEQKTTANTKITFWDIRLKERDVDNKMETGETLTAKLKIPRIKKGATPEISPSYPSKSTSTKVSKKGQKLSKSKKLKSPKKAVRKTKSANVMESTPAIKKEPQEPTEEPPSLVIGKAISTKELLSSPPGSPNVMEPFIAIKQEPVDEPPPLVIDNVLCEEGSLPSESVSSFSENLCLSSSSVSSLSFGNPDSTNQEKTSVTIKPERKRKINVVKPNPNGSKRAKYHLPANPSVLSKKASVTKKSSARSVSPTEDTQNATRDDIFRSFLDGSETNPGSRSFEKPGDLFDVFGSFIAEKLRAMNWDDCAVILRSILELVLKSGHVHRSSDEDNDEEETDISDSYKNSSYPSDEV